MKRSEALASLSRDHHTALVHALQLRRATDSDVAATAAVFLAFLLGEGGRHFELEESVLLPELPGAAAPLGDRVLEEHARIRAGAAELGATLDLGAAHVLGELLADHVRFEERELFAVLEALPDEALADLARRLETSTTQPAA